MAKDNSFWSISRGSDRKIDPEIVRTMIEREYPASARAVIRIAIDAPDNDRVTRYYASSDDLPHAPRDWPIGSTSSLQRHPYASEWATSVLLDKIRSAHADAIANVVGMPPEFASAIMRVRTEIGADWARGYDGDF